MAAADVIQNQRVLVNGQFLAQRPAGVGFGADRHEEDAEPVAQMAPQRGLGIIEAIVVFLVNGAVGQFPGFIAGVAPLRDGLQQGVFGLPAEALAGISPVQDVHVEAVHGPHFPVELALDDDVGMNAAFALEHDVVVFQTGGVGVYQREMDQADRILDNADDSRVQIAAAGVVIVIEGALGIRVARHDAMKVVGQFPAILDDRGGADVLAGVVAESDFEHAVVEDQVLDVIGAVITRFGRFAVEDHLHLVRGKGAEGEDGRGGDQQQSATTRCKFHGNMGQELARHI